MLACFFCCAKMKQCEEFQRKCLKAEELFSQMLNEDCETNSSMNHSHPEFYGGFIKTSVEQISLDGTCQMECNPIKEELPAVDDIQDDIIEPAEESESESERNQNQNQPAEEIPGDEHLLRDKLTTHHKDPLDIAPNHSKADTKDAPILKFITERGLIVAVRKYEGDTTTDEPKKNEPSDSKTIRNTDSGAPKSVTKSVTKSNKTLKCDQRGLVYLNRVTNVNTHNDTHVTDKPYECEICHRCFRFKSNLEAHIAYMHTDEKPYKCDICHKTFKRPGDFKTHIRIHQKPYKCDLCNRYFSRSIYLKQ